MGLLDRFARVDAELEGDNDGHDQEDETVTDGMVLGDPVADAIVGILEPFIDPADQFSGMLLAVARRYLADATPEQLREVVANLCAASDTLGPICSPPIRRTTEPVRVELGQGDSGRAGTAAGREPSPPEEGGAGAGGETAQAPATPVG